MTGNTYNNHRLALIVDDQKINRDLLGSILKDQYDVLYACDGVEALSVIREKKLVLSVILLDLLMPNMDGFEVLRHLREEKDIYGETPVIVLTSEKSAELNALQLGAADFITKPYDLPEIILARVERIIELREGKDLIQSAGRDRLTGLYNASFFFRFCEQTQLYNPDWKMDCGALNIDRFRTINELYGHDFGNKVLCLVAKTLEEYIRSAAKGIAGRGEADQFYFFFPHCDSYQPLIDRIQENLRTLPESVRVRIRLGICPSSSEVPLSTRFERARTACNMLRNSFKSSIMIYDDRMHDSELHDEQLTNDLSKAVNERQFIVYYQPKYDIQCEPPRLKSAEALIRWNHPQLGLVSPGEFIPMFERNGLIHIVDNYVWEEAARQIAEWKQKLNVTLPVSVNLSRVDIFDPKLEDNLLQLIHKNGLSPSDLLLEVTETAYTDDAGQLIDVAERLRSRGFRIEMDDFGSGYSSLNMLSLLPIDALKMDMKFIQNVRPENKDFRMIELILGIAEYLGVPVIAEGVETKEQLELLKNAGCSLVQGYYFSKPIPPDQFEQLIRNDLSIATDKE